MSDQEEQEDELLALSSIYDEILKVIKEDGFNGGEISAKPQLPEDFQVLFNRTCQENSRFSCLKETSKSYVRLQ